MRTFTLLYIAGLFLCQSLLAETPKVAIPDLVIAPALEKRMKSDVDEALLERALAELDLQINNQVTESHLFDAAGEESFEEAINALNKEDLTWSDFSNPKFVSAIRSKGFNYLLAVSLDDVEDQTARLGTKQGVTAQNRKQVAVQKNSSAKVKRKHGRITRIERRKQAQAAAAQLKTRAVVGKTVTELQKIHMSVRCRIFDVTAREWIDAASFSITTNRTSEVLDETDRELSDELLRLAALNISKRVAARLAEARYPLKIVSIENDVVTINRGKGTQVKAGQVYAARAEGKEIFDPTTKESLGRDESTVGRVRVTEVGDKFSKGIITANNGLAVGATLRSSAD